MLDLDAPVEVHSTPFRWALIEGILPERNAATLRGAMPGDLKQIARVSGSDKTYSVHHRLLVAPDGTQTAFGPWIDLVQALACSQYREFIEDLGRVNLSGAFLEVALNSYTAGGYMSPHTDRWPKLITHVIYLSDRWHSSWGGHLNILAGRESEPVYRIEPVWPSSVLLVRSDHSWHEVEPVHARAALPRQTIQVSFWSEPPRQQSPGRITMS